MLVIISVHSFLSRQSFLKQIFLCAMQPNYTALSFLVSPCLSFLWTLPLLQHIPVFFFSWDVQRVWIIFSDTVIQFSLWVILSQNIITLFICPQHSHHSSTNPQLCSLQERQSSCGRPNPGSDNWEIVLTMQTIGPTFLRQGKIKGRFTCLKVFGYLVLDFIDQFLDQPALDVWYEYLHVRGARGVNYHNLETPYTKWYTKWYSRICIDKWVMR